MKHDWSTVVIIGLFLATAFIAFRCGEMSERKNSVVSKSNTEYVALQDSVKAHTEVLIWMRGCIRDDARTTAIRKYPKWKQVK